MLVLVDLGEGRCFINPLGGVFIIAFAVCCFVKKVSVVELNRVVSVSKVREGIPIAFRPYNGIDFPPPLPKIFLPNGCQSLFSRTFDRSISENPMLFLSSADDF